MIHVIWLPKTGISSGTLRSVIDYGLLFHTHRMAIASWSQILWRHWHAVHTHRVFRAGSWAWWRRGGRPTPARWRRTRCPSRRRSRRRRGRVRPLPSIGPRRRRPAPPQSRCRRPSLQHNDTTHTHTQTDGPDRVHHPTPVCSYRRT